MKLNYFDNLYSKIATQIDFEELLTKVYDKKKEELPMFNFCSHSSSTSSGNDMTCAIVLDYDDGEETYVSFIKKFKDYKFFIYTTASNSAYKEKFRVVIPLSKWYSYKVIEKFVKYHFNSIDACSGTSVRRFYLPSKYDKDGNLTRRGWVANGKIFDSVVNIESEVELYDMINSNNESFTTKIIRNCDCSKFEHVKTYLNTPYPNVKGNGGASMNGLFSSICSCVKFNDDKTLNKVIEKAKTEHWTDKEINRIIDKAEKLCEK